MSSSPADNLTPPDTGVPTMTDLLQRTRSGTALPAESVEEPRWSGWTAERVAGTIEIIVLAWFLVLRIVAITTAEVPRIHPDEVGSWAVADLLSGSGGRIDLGFQPIYPLFSGVVLAPLYWVTEDPVLRYRLGLVVMAVFLLAGAWALRQVVPRLVDSDPMLRAGVFVIALLAPALTVTGSFTWAETTSFACLAAMVALSGAAIHRRSDILAIATGVVAGVAPAVHGRLSLVAVVWLVVVSMLCLPRLRSASGLGRRALAASGAVTVVLVGVGRVVRGAVVDRVWEEPLVIDFWFLEQTGQWSLYENVFVIAVGQLWYLGASTYGLAYAGVAWLAINLWRGNAERRMIGAIWTALLAAVFVTSVLFIAGGVTNDGYFKRFDYLIYGRYIDAVCVVFAVLGLLLLWESRTTVRRRVLPAAVLALVPTAAVIAVRSAQMDVYLLPPTVAGVSSMPFDGDSLALLPWTLIAVVGGGVIAAAAWRSRRAAVLAVVSVFAVASIWATSEAINIHETWDYDTLYEGTPPPEGSGLVVVPVEVVRRGGYPLRSPSHQYMLVDDGWRFELDSRTSEQLAAKPDPGIEMMVLLEGSPPAGWEQVTGIGAIEVWRRPPG